jgi:hypothetical protein
MTVPSANAPVSPARTITIYRPAGGIEGYREIHDEISNVTVACFPWVTVREAPTPAVTGRLHPCRSWPWLLWRDQRRQTPHG